MKKLRAGFIVIAAAYIILIFAAYYPHETRPVSSFTDKNDEFVVINNKRIHYIRQGSGPPVILIHGFAGSTFTWRKLMPLLANSYSVYALDLPGFGLSDKPPGSDYDLRSQAECVRDFIKKLDIEPAILVGHSMGGVVVSYAAVMSPSLIDRLVIIDAGFYSGGAPAFLKYLFFPLDRIMAKIFYTRSFREKSLMSSYYDTSVVTDEVIDAYLRAGKTPNAVDALATMISETDAGPYKGLSGKITVPTLLVWGKQDTNIPVSDGWRLKKEIGSAVQLVVIDECGHMVQEEKPRQLAEAITRFLQKTR